MVHLYVDVDGVLNAVSWHTPDWGWPDEQQRIIDGYPLRWSAAMTARLARIAATPGVSAHWLTTWGRRAPRLIAPALGLPTDWPVLGDTERERAVDTLAAGAGASWWKLDAVRAHLPSGVPAVWLDDDLGRDPEALAWVRERGDVLPVSPATGTGLVPGHLAQVEEFLRAWA